MAAEGLVAAQLDAGLLINVTHDNVIRRELFTRPGDYFSRANIFRSLRQLSQLNYFNPEKIKMEDLVRSGSVADEAE